MLTAYVYINERVVVNTMLAENRILRTVVIETAFPLTFMGNISAGYVHDTGPMVAAKLQIGAQNLWCGRRKGNTYLQINK